MILPVRPYSANATPGGVGGALAAEHPHQVAGADLVGDEGPGHPEHVSGTSGRPGQAGSEYSLLGASARVGLVQVRPFADFAVSLIGPVDGPCSAAAPRLAEPAT